MHFLFIRERKNSTNVGKKLTSLHKQIQNSFFPYKDTEIKSEDALNLGYLGIKNPKFPHPFENFPNYVSGIVSAENGQSIIFNKILEYNSEKSQSNDNNEFRSLFLDGNYVIVGNSENTTRILIDMAGTHPCWYYFSDSFFMCSSSQTLILMVLGTLDFNYDAIPFFLVNGHLGSFDSWDKRLILCPAHSLITLDVPNWALSTQILPISFQSTGFTEEGSNWGDIPRLGNEIARIFTQTLTSSRPNNKIIGHESGVLLSGGVDSRGIALLFKKCLPFKPHFITWGSQPSLQNEESDFFIAEKIASVLQLEHHQYSLDPENFTLDQLDLFIYLSEGQIDHFGGYIDGFDLWQDLHEHFDVVIRGDECFGWVPVDFDRQARHTIGYVHPEESNLKKKGLLHNVDKISKDHKINGELFSKRTSNESLPQYRDRIYLDFRLARVLSRLNTAKLHYCEIYSPLLSGSVIQWIRSIPDSLRTNKKLWNIIVNHLSQESPTKGLPYANFSSLPSFSEIFRSLAKDSQFSSIILDNPLISRAYCQSLLEKISQYRDEKKTHKYSHNEYNNPREWKTLLKKVLPASILNLGSGLPKISIDPTKILFRIYIISKIYTFYSDLTSKSGNV